MFAFERRWAHATLEGFAPPTGPGLAPRDVTIDWMAAWDIMNDGGTAKARIGTRLAVWIMVFAPLWMLIAPRTLPSLSIEERSRVIDRLLTSKIWLVKELALLVKLIASMALLGDPTLRARSGYDANPNGVGVVAPDEFLPKPPRRKLAIFSEPAAGRELPRPSPSGTTTNQGAPLAAASMSEVA
jgi:hypothetical protein